MGAVSAGPMPAPCPHPMATVCPTGLSPPCTKLPPAMRATLHFESSRSPALPPGEGVSNVSQKAACASPHPAGPGGGGGDCTVPAEPPPIAPAAPPVAGSDPVPVIEPEEELDDEPAPLAPLFDPLESVGDAEQAPRSANSRAEYRTMTRILSVRGLARLSVGTFCLTFMLTADEPLACFLARASLVT